MGLRAYFDVALPKRIYDAHFHLSTSYKNRKTCKGEPLDNTTECTLALLEACELLSLGKSDLEAIFYDNAKAIYG